MNNKINRIHERALRLVYLDYTSSFDELLKKDNSVCIHHRNIQLVAIEMYKVLKGLGPEIMRSLFDIDYNTRSEKSFLRPNIKSKFNGENSIRYFGPVVWDTAGLPIEVDGMGGAFSRQFRGVSGNLGLSAT